MGRELGFWDRLANEADFASETLPGLPIVELAGEGRVLIENHFGVKAYTRERIVIKVKYGCVNVCGSHLEILRMTRDQLVICGRIDSVSLQRRISK